MEEKFKLWGEGIEIYLGRNGGGIVGVGFFLDGVVYGVRRGIEASEDEEAGEGSRKED